MKVRISLEVEVTPEMLQLVAGTHWERNGAGWLVRHVLLDAFAEFRAARRPPEEYVAKRYPNGNPLGAEKVREVRARNSVAEALHKSVFNGTIEEESE